MSPRMYIGVNVCEYAKDQIKEWKKNESKKPCYNKTICDIFLRIKR